MGIKRMYFGLLALIVLLVVGLVAGAYGANKLLSARADTLTGLRAKSQALSEQQVRLVEAKREIQKYAGLEKIAQVVVPQDKDQAEAVRELVNIAGANGVALGSITFPSSSLGQSSGSNSAGSSSTSSSASSAPPASATSPSSPANKLSQLTIAKGLPGVYQLTITIQGDQNHPVKYTQIINFLHGLEQDRRTAQVTSISLTPDTQNPGLLDFALTLNEYIKP